MRTLLLHFVFFGLTAVMATTAHGQDIPTDLLKAPIGTNLGDQRRAKVPDVQALAEEVQEKIETEEEVGNEKYYYLPMIKPSNIITPEDFDEAKALTGETDVEGLDVLSVGYQDLLFRYVFQTETGRVLYLGIFDNEKVIYANNFEHNLSYLEEDYAAEDPKAIPFARFVDLDINANGRNDYVIESYSGGVHCCYETLFFEEDEAGTLKFKGKIPSQHRRLTFASLDGDDSYEIELIDWQYDYWMVPFNVAPEPRVVLDNNASDWYQASPRHMEEIIDRAELATKAREIKHDQENWKKYDVHPDLLKVALTKLIYTGNGDEFLPFVNQAWPDDQQDRKEWFIAQLEDVVATSPYWNSLKAANGWVSTSPYTDMLAERRRVAEEKEAAARRAARVEAEKEAYADGDEMGNRAPSEHEEEKVPSPDADAESRIWIFGAK